MREFDERLPQGNRPPQTFSAHFLEEISRHKTFSAHFLEKSAATKLFGSFPQEIGRHKTFRLISSGNRPDVDRLRIKLTIR